MKNKPTKTTKITNTEDLCKKWSCGQDILERIAVDAQNLTDDLRLGDLASELLAALDEVRISREDFIRALAQVGIKIGN